VEWLALVCYLPIMTLSIFWELLDCLYLKLKLV
jgi:hypothetical protein